MALTFSEVSLVGGEQRVGVSTLGQAGSGKKRTQYRGELQIRRYLQLARRVVALL